MKNSIKPHIILFIAIIFCSCKDNKDSESSTINFQKTKYQEVEVAPLKKRNDQSSEKLFTKLSPDLTNIDFVNQIDLNEPMKRLYHSGFVCGGVALGDFNQDNKLDIFLVSPCEIAKTSEFVDRMALFEVSPGPEGSKIVRESAPGASWAALGGPAGVHGAQVEVHGVQVGLHRAQVALHRPF